MQKNFWIRYGILALIVVAISTLSLFSEKIVCYGTHTMWTAESKSYDTNINNGGCLINQGMISFIFGSHGGGGHKFLHMITLLSLPVILLFFLFPRNRYLLQGTNYLTRPIYVISLATFLMLMIISSIFLMLPSSSVVLQVLFFTLLCLSFGKFFMLLKGRVVRLIVFISICIISILVIVSGGIGFSMVFFQLFIYFLFTMGYYLIPLFYMIVFYFFLAISKRLLYGDSFPESTVIRN